MAGLVIDIWIGFIVRWMIIIWREASSHQWPTFAGTIVRCEFEEHGFGGDYVVLRYKYKVNSERFDGMLKKPYMFPNYADAFVRHHPAGLELSVHVNPKAHTRSFPVLD